MIEIVNKEDCCGCSACVQACPVQCISMKTDEEGFLYPDVGIDKCVNCNLCETVCPVINQSEPKEPHTCYAAKNPDDEIRMKSSSGGVFTMLAERTIGNGGVVFGARFDEQWNVVHDYTETVDGLERFRGSKYVQSRIGNCFKEAKRFLDDGREVLFSGTPCQIAGLKRFLRKDYPNLIAVDIICHGVPSPMVWKKYLMEIIARKGEKNSVSTYPNEKEQPVITGLSFRNKATGWKKYSFALTLSEATASEKNTVLLSSVFDRNPFMLAFLRDLILRPSCYRCPDKNGSSGSDLTIADFWGVQNLFPEFDDDKGINLIIVNTEKGQAAFDAVDTDRLECEIDDAVRYNSSYRSSVRCPAGYRDYFFRKIGEGMTCEAILAEIDRKQNSTGFYRIFVSIKHKIKRLIRWISGY